METCWATPSSIYSKTYTEGSAPLAYNEHDLHAPGGGLPHLLGMAFHLPAAGFPVPVGRRDGANRAKGHSRSEHRRYDHHSVHLHSFSLVILIDCMHIFFSALNIIPSFSIFVEHYTKSTMTTQHEVAMRNSCLLRGVSLQGFLDFQLECLTIPHFVLQVCPFSSLASRRKCQPSIKRDIYIKIYPIYKILSIALTL